MTERAHELWERLKPFAIHDLNPFLNNSKISGLTVSGFNIILFDYTNKRQLEFPFSEDGLLFALEEATNESLILLPPGELTITQAISISHDVILMGSLGIWDNGSFLGSVLRCSNDVGLSFVSTGSSAVVFKDMGIIYDSLNAPSARHALFVYSQVVLDNCLIQCDNSGAGRATGIHAAKTGGISQLMMRGCNAIGRNQSTGDGYGMNLYASAYSPSLIWNSKLLGSSVSGQGIGIAIETGSEVKMEGCIIQGSTIGVKITFTEGGG